MTLYIYDKNEIKLVRTLEGVLTDRDTIKTDGGETIVLGDGLGVSFGDAFAADEREKALGIARKYVVAGRITERKDLGKVGAYLWQRGFGRSTIDEVIPSIADELGGEMFPDA